MYVLCIVFATKMSHIVYLSISTYHFNRVLIDCVIYYLTEAQTFIYVHILR